VSASPAIYTLSLHDALPIFLVVVDGDGDLDRRLATGDPLIGMTGRGGAVAISNHRKRAVGIELRVVEPRRGDRRLCRVAAIVRGDRKSTRLNSSHVKISYAV